MFIISWLGFQVIASKQAVVAFTPIQSSFQYSAGVRRFDFQVRASKNNKPLQDENDVPSWMKAIGRWSPQLNSTFEVTRFDSLLPDLLDIAALLTVSDRNKTQKMVTKSNYSLPQSYYDTVTSDGNPTDLSSVAEFLAVLDENKTQNESTEQSILAVLPAVESIISKTGAAAAGLFSNLILLEELLEWESWTTILKGSVNDIIGVAKNSTKSISISKTSESILKLANGQVEVLASVLSSIVSPNKTSSLIREVRRIIENTTLASNVLEAAQNIAMRRGLNSTQADQRARDVAAFTANLSAVADSVVNQGYVADGVRPEKQVVSKDLPSQTGSRALFADFSTANELDRFSASLSKAAEMGALAGALYDDVVPRTHALGHSIVAIGVTRNVRWMVTDSVVSQDLFQEKVSSAPTLVRTIVIRGFDASDSGIDREELLNKICSSTPEQLTSTKPDGNAVVVHTGLLDLARALYEDVKQYIDWMPPSHKIVLAGHSVGGSLSILLLFLFAENRGNEFIRDSFLRVYAYGNPPIARLVEDETKKTSFSSSCDILNALDLPSDLVHCYIQPWDPIVRLFTDIDALYPLFSDIGVDGVSPYASGPPRTLRVILKAVFEAWKGFPQFRDTLTAEKQSYRSIGVQHILIPEPTRYLADRFIAVRIPVPQVEVIVQISSNELLNALNMAFPLDTFELSFVPQAIRGFVHHFYPAYNHPLVDYVKRLALQKKIGRKISSSSINGGTTKPQSLQTPRSASRLLR